MPRFGASLAVLISAAFCDLACNSSGSLPKPKTPIISASADDVAIEAAPICFGSTVASAGDLADDVYYREVRRPNGDLEVGYLVFFSEERPWGDNWQTWTLLPSLAIDLVYTRAFFIGPGIQRATYGKGDVEGVRVVYTKGEDGALHVARAFAEDGRHRQVEIDPAAAFALDHDRATFYTDVWSHQLGGNKAHTLRDLAYRRCYQGGHVRPLDDATAREFHVAERAKVARLDR